MVSRVIAVIVATVVPDVGPMISLVGSVGFSVLGLIVPAVLETVWYWDPKSEHDFQDAIDEMNCVSETVEDGIGLASVAALTSKDSKTDEIRQKIATRRTLRVVKNSLYILLALFALTGGAFYNLREMFTPALSHSVPAPDTIPAKQF